MKNRAADPSRTADSSRKTDPEKFRKVFLENNFEIQLEKVVCVISR
jgi:hypothetical protein